VRVTDPLGNLAAIYPYVFAAMALPAGSLSHTLGPRLPRVEASKLMALASAGIILGKPPLVAYHAAFTLCLEVALGAVVAACLSTETRCRNI
jgi:hypothetical protein